MRMVQIPDDVYQQASQMAEQDEVSVDRVIAALLRDGVGEWARLQARASRGSREKLRSVLDKISDRTPEDKDQL